MISQINENNLFIKQTYIDYKNEFQLNLPEIQDIEYTKTQLFWARFKASDLYNKKYFLYISDDLFNHNKKFVNQILYHEFTHLADSIYFIKYPEDEFKKYMASYSEFHASEIEMTERLNEVAENNLTPQTEIIHIGILTIESFLNQTFEFMKKDLEKMSKNNNIKTFFYNVNHIYYFFGYIKSIKKHNIDYNYYTFDLPSTFLLDIKRIEKILLDEKINYTEILSSFEELVNNIKSQFAVNSLFGKY